MTSSGSSVAAKAGQATVVAVVTVASSCVGSVVLLQHRCTDFGKSLDALIIARVTRIRAPLVIHKTSLAVECQELMRRHDACTLPTDGAHLFGHITILAKRFHRNQVERVVFRASRYNKTRLAHFGHILTCYRHLVANRDQLGCIDLVRPDLVNEFINIVFVTADGRSTIGQCRITGDAAKFENQSMRFGKTHERFFHEGWLARLHQAGTNVVLHRHIIARILRFGFGAEDSIETFDATLGGDLFEKRLLERL